MTGGPKSKCVIKLRGQDGHVIELKLENLSDLGVSLVSACINAVATDKKMTNGIRGAAVTITAPRVKS